MSIPQALLLRRIVLIVTAVLAAARLGAQPASAVPPAHVFFRVQAPPSDAPVSGRLLIFLKQGRATRT